MTRFIILDSDDMGNLVDGKEVVVRMSNNETVSVVTEETYNRIMSFEEKKEA